jgi:hypothetical protein
LTWRDLTTHDSEVKIIKTVAVGALLGFISAVAVMPRALAQEGATRVASVSYFTLRVHLNKNYAGIPKLVEYFSTTDPANHSVACVSAFLDVKYALHDASGKLVPIDQEPWKHGLDQTIGSFGYVAGEPDPCKTIKQDMAIRTVLITYFYPSLAHGSYTLQVTLAPRGTDSRATLAPIGLTI